MASRQVGMMVKVVPGVAADIHVTAQVLSAARRVLTFNSSYA
jgi:hypothetical protein